MTPDELMTLLRRSGSLRRGSVVDVQATENAAFNSHVRHLRVRYSPDADPQLPAALVLKQNVDTDWGRQDGRNETAFYRMAGADGDRLPMMIRYVGSPYDEITEDSSLLLEDLSETHCQPVTRDDQIHLRNIPTDAVTGAVVTTMANFHAQWWERPELGVFPISYDPAFGSAEAWVAECQENTDNLTGLLAANGAWMPTSVTDHLREIDRLLPRAWDRYLCERVQTGRGMTVVHGDAYFANFLVPKAGDGQVHVMDWQSPRAGFGAYDLVMLLASFWTGQQRAENRREQVLIAAYLATLHANGVRFTRDALMTDYRLMIMVFLQVAIWDHANGSATDYWWPKIQCLEQAARDHDCVRLLA